jgi:hypothetical protein
MASVDEGETQLAAATAVVLAFGERMNAWDNGMYYRTRFEQGKFIQEENARWIGDRSAEDLKLEYHAIISEYCTTRERKYGGQPTSWAKGGRYAGIARGGITEGKLVAPDRIELVAKCGLLPRQQYKFVLFRKRALWLIDNIFAGMGGEWDRAYL